MSVPPEGTPSTGSTGLGSTRPGMPAMPAMPFPMNPEFIVYLLIWIIVALSWIISDDVVINQFLIYTVALTIGYLLSRGIAKASRVYE